MSKGKLNTDTLLIMLDILDREYPHWDAPVVSFMAQTQGTPYTVLISTLLSLRTKDETTGPAALRLFKQADKPVDMLKLSEEKIRKLIYPVGFYKVKAGRIREISRILLDHYQGIVPDTIEELLTLPGVGRKTANLVIILGYRQPGMCVDVHVHRISNRWDFIRTKTPDQSEMDLRTYLPLKWWMHYNDLLVAFGQTICKPVSPFCSRCPVSQYCPRTGVEKSR